MDLQKKEWQLGFYGLLFMILALIPLYFIAGYAHPCLDDYNYGAATAAAWAESGSFSDVLAKAWEGTATSYQTHQGTFASIFLMRLMPGIYGEHYYFLTTVFLLSSFLLCSIAFYFVFFTRVFHADKRKAWIISAVLSFGAMEFTHVVCDSFYWYNGGVTYTFFYSMEVLLFTFLVLMFTAKKRLPKILWGILSMMLAFFTCGGNFVTSFVTLELLFLIFLITAAAEYRQSRTQKTDHLKLFLCLLVLLAAAISFLLITTAPGNAIRQGKDGETINPVAAIFLSLVYGAYSIGNCLDLPALVLLLFCVPLFVVIARKSSFSFPYPWGILFFSYCLYSSQVTPVFYSQGIEMPYRIMNIVYFSCFVMAALNLFYFIGYGLRNWPQCRLWQILSGWHEKHFWQFYATAALLLCFTTAGNISISAEVNMDKSITMNVTELPATLNACYSLLNGEAQQYDQECYERYRLYSNPDIQDVVVEPFSVTPDILFHSDITTDARHWKNLGIKKYFHKNSIRRKE